MATYYQVMQAGGLRYQRKPYLCAIFTSKVDADAYAAGITNAIVIEAIDAEAPTFLGKLSIGTGAAVSTGALAVSGGDTFTTFPGDRSALGNIKSSTGWEGPGFLFSKNANHGFSLVMGLDNNAYFGMLTNTAFVIAITIFANGSTHIHSAV